MAFDEYGNDSTYQIGQQLNGTPDSNSPDYQGQTQNVQQQQQGPVWNKAARNAFRDAWMSEGGNYGGDLQRFINEHPTASPYKDQFRVEGDKLYIKPTVDDKYGSMGDEVIDAVQDYGVGGQNKAAWTGIGPGSGGAPNNVYPNGAPPGAGGGGGGFQAPGSTVGGLSGAGGKADTLFDLLMSRATQAESVDKNNPIIRAQSDAFNAQGQQARRDFLSQQAEKAGPYGNQTSEERRSAEELGKSTGAFEAQAMSNELSAKRQEIENALSGAAGFLTQQQQMQLQEELQRLTLQQQESQYGRTLGQNAYEFDTNRYDNIFGK